MILALRTRCTRAMQRHLPDARGSTASTTATCRGRAATKLRYQGPLGGCRRCSVTDVFSVNSTCLESPTWKTDQSSRVKIIEPAFGWLGNPPRGTRILGLSISCRMLGTQRLTIRTVFCAGCAGGPVDPEHLWRHQDMRRARRFRDPRRSMGI
jgi:hypothetical protein